MVTAQQARALRRRRRQERQAVVFGSIVAGLAVAGLFATAVYTGALDAPFLEREFTRVEDPEPTTVVSAPPCPTEDAAPVPYGDIEIQVLNGTGRTGLAGVTAESLTARGFDVVSTGDFSPQYPGVAQIFFGQESVDAAYTLAAHVPDSVLVLDLRDGTAIDLVVGTAWESLMEEEQVVLAPDEPLEPRGGCISLEEALQVAQPAPGATLTGEAGEDVEGDEDVDGGEEPAGEDTEGD
ncbi:LytR C-terminal domain-containing protein [Cellulomonas bogoriensis]|uniref:LytR/CpsA/Psr regulator C-terminal domain-containing protein n=1 Tax=Cellulomonas bogoriensis 69B4 = DSM 16987 TaxID=1386082 RepID=A0A0A0C0D5_9CELL|nr:LytR C-terminal domain-containing protein [Cellulomonas bogoriensis]KGM14118.1 hypothetical protein N869_04000 [Cellulomonas bogoriensis 69B4 = DSM 16987]